MASSPRYKVYVLRTVAGDGSGAVEEYVASCKYAEDAAALVAVLGEGATIRFGHGPVLWAEGREDQSAGESYDHVREVCDAREHRYQVEAYDKAHGRGSAARLMAKKT